MVVVHANHLAAAGHDVSLLTAVVDTVFSLDPRITVTRLPSSAKAGTILAALTTSIAADLVVADIIAMACFLFPRNRSRVVYFAQDYDESYYSSPLLKGLIRSLYLLGLKIFLIPVIAVSRPLADLLGNRFLVRVTVAENGIDTGVFYPDPDPALIAGKGERRAVLILSRSDRRKGFDLARDVVQRLAAASAGLAEIWTVGEPCEGLSPDYVHRDFGYVGEEQLRRIMSSADLFLYPTRHEGLPLMPLEAMACGCPVVTTTAVPYAVHGGNALVSEVGDCEDIARNLRQLLADDDLRNRVRESGRRFAGGCTLAAATERFEAALVGLVPR